MKVSELKSSRFLKKEDVGDGTEVTISHVTQENVAQEGAPQELKWCLHFQETDKPLVLNSTNGQILEKITGYDDSDYWTGARVELYNDPSVGFGGKLMGGIRIRAIRGAAPAASQNKGPTPDQMLSKAKGDAWQAFKGVMPGASASELKAAIEEVVTAFFPGKTPADLNAQQWRKMQDAGFKPPVNPLPDRDPGLDEPPF